MRIKSALFLLLISWASMSQAIFFPWQPPTPTCTSKLTEVKVNSSTSVMDLYGTCLSSIKQIGIGYNNNGDSYVVNVPDPTVVVVSDNHIMVDLVTAPVNVLSDNDHLVQVLGNPTTGLNIIFPLLPKCDPKLKVMDQWI